MIGILSFRFLAITALVVLLMSASPLVAQQKFLIEQAMKDSSETYAQKILFAGQLTATAQTADRGYITVSKINSRSFLVRRINERAQKLWEKRLNFTVDGGLFEVSIPAITQTMDGGFMLAGGLGDVAIWDYGNDYMKSAALIKLNPNGSIAWKKRFAVDAEDWRGPVTSHKLSEYTSVIAMPDGGVIAIGGMVHLLYEGTTRFLVLRIATNGEVIWKKSFETFVDYNVFFRRSLEVTQSDGLVLAFSGERNQDGVDVLKISHSGNVVWRRSLNTNDYTFHSLGTTNDNGVVLFGTNTDSNRLKVIVLKADGTISSTAAYILKIPGSFKSIASPIQTDDGGYAIAGGTYDQSNGKNYGFIAKIGTNRNVTIESTFRMEHGTRKSIYPARDGGFVLFGNSNKRDVVVLKVNSEATLPGCEGLPNVQYGSAPRSSFGPLKISQVSPIEMNPLVGSIDIGVTALVTNHAVANLCQ